MSGYCIPPRVAHVVLSTGTERPTKMYLMHLPDGVPVRLRGSAVWIWLAAVEGESDVAGAVAHIVGRRREEVAADVEAFLDDLVRRGLLDRGSDS